MSKAEIFRKIRSLPLAEQWELAVELQDILDCEDKLAPKQVAEPGRGISNEQLPDKMRSEHKE